MHFDILLTTVLQLLLIRDVCPADLSYIYPRFGEYKTIYEMRVELPSLNLSARELKKMIKYLSEGYNFIWDGNKSKRQKNKRQNKIRIRNIAYPLNAQ